MTSLALPRPDNLRGRYGALVESDVYDICSRIKEVDPNLYIQLLDPPVQFAGKVYHYAIVEVCRDGVERLVCRVEELDARVIEHMQYLLHVPFEKRFAEAERLEAKAEAERREKEHAELYERIGRPMWTDLERCGFIQRPASYAKRGIRK